MAVRVARARGGCATSPQHSDITFGHMNESQHQTPICVPRLSIFFSMEVLPAASAPLLCLRGSVWYYPAQPIGAVCKPLPHFYWHPPSSSQLKSPSSL